MSIKQLNPYLMFNGTAAKAIAHYEKALGAKVEGMMRYGDIPGGTPSPETAHLVVHALLRIDGHVVMVSDGRPDLKVPVGNNVNVALEFDDLEDGKRRFAALAEGGVIETPLQEAFWGGVFGALVDAFGVSWMFNCPKK